MPDDLKKFIFIEETRPYDELTDENVYVKTAELGSHLPDQFFREMQCEVVMSIIETRWTVEVKDEMEVIMPDCSPAGERM